MRPQQAPVSGKVFIQRDYSGGTRCQFQSKFPAELENRVRRSGLGSARGERGARSLHAGQGRARALRACAQVAFVGALPGSETVPRVSRGQGSISYTNL